MKILVIIILIAVSCTVVAEQTNPYVEYRAQTYEIQKEYLERVSEHQIKIMDDLEQKLKQQKWQTNDIAIMVFIMVSVGLGLSFLQFRQDAKEGTKSSVSIKFGQGNFEINSSVIGLVILALSFWFFQTYIDKVYSVETFQVRPIDVTTFGVNK